MQYPPTVTIPKKIRAFAKSRGLKLRQVNAQRIIGPSINIDPSWAPAKGSELFLFQLDRSLDETVLVPLLEKCGPFFQLRLMVTFSGTNNRGYAFVQYFNPTQAELALQALRNYVTNNEDVKKRFVVSMSVDNCRLLLGPVPTSITGKEVFEELSKFSEGVVRVWWDWWDTRFPILKTGSIMVLYESHRFASLAKNKMLSADYRPWGSSLAVDWVSPETSQETPFPETSHLLLKVWNLPPRTTTETLTDLFNKFGSGGVTGVEFRNQRTAIVQFSTRGQAQAAKIGLDQSNFKGRQIIVEWNEPDPVTIYNPDNVQPPAPALADMPMVQVEYFQ